MLLSDLMFEVQDQLGEVPGTEPYRNYPALLGHVTRTIDEVCRRTRCLYDTYRAPLTAGQSLVAGGSCYPCPIFEITEARCTFADGSVNYLLLQLPEWVRWSPLGWQVCANPFNWWGWGGGGFDWRDALSFSYPYALVAAGVNELRLFPAPNYSDPFIVVNSQNVYTARSLAITGFATPQPPLNQDGTTRTTWLETDNFQLPDRFADLVIEGAKWRRMQTYRKLYAPIEVQQQRELYERQLAMAVIEGRRQQTGAGSVIGAYA